MFVSFPGSYSIERYARSNFLQRRVIERRTNELEEKNAELTAKNQMLAQSRAQTMRTAQRSELIFSALSEALPGTVLDEQYRIAAQICSGNFGTVFRGEHILLHHPVAIKVFRPAVGNAGLESLERFRLEGMSRAASIIRMPFRSWTSTYPPGASHISSWSCSRDTRSRRS